MYFRIMHVNCVPVESRTPDLQLVIEASFPLLFLVLHVKDLPSTEFVKPCKGSISYGLYLVSFKKPDD